jgi:hypothetical protein
MAKRICRDSGKSGELVPDGRRQLLACCGLLLVLLLTRTAFAQYTALQVGSGTVAAGGSLKIAVTLGPNASSATAAGFTLQYDPAVATIGSSADI